MLLSTSYAMTLRITRTLPTGCPPPLGFNILSAVPCIGRNGMCAAVRGFGLGASLWSVLVQVLSYCAVGAAKSLVTMRKWGSVAWR